MRAVVCAVLALCALPACSGGSSSSSSPPPGQATSIAILNLGSGDVLRINRPVSVQASVGAPGGATQVELLVDGVVQSTLVAAPYSFTFAWSALGAPLFGNHAITVRATWPDSSLALATADVLVVAGPFATSSADRIIYAPDDLDAAGFPRGVAAGDLDGDNLDDIVFGAPFADGASNGGTNRGDVYVIAGAVNGVASLDLRATAPLASLHGARANDWFGYQVAIGDVNGDGTDDLVVGAPQADGPSGTRANCGAVYVFYGGTGFSGIIDLAGTGSAGVVIHGADAGDQLGLTVAVGDVNGDSTPDICMGAPTSNGPSNARTAAGEVHVLFGGTSLPLTLDLSAAAASVVIYGIDANDLYGEGLRTGDVTGDAIADLCIGSRFADGPTNTGNNEGEVAVVAGSLGLTGSIDMASTAPRSRIYGASAQDQIGTHFAIGPIDGNVGNELIIGAFLGDGPLGVRTDAGEVVVVAGGTTLPVTLDLSLTAPLLVFYGQRSNDFLGWGIAAGDIDGDGDFDLVLGQRGSEGPTGTSTDCGEVLVWLNPGAASLPSTVDFNTTAAGHVIFGVDGADRLGYALALADVNGDGQLDILGVADLGDGPGNAGTDRGELIVIER